MPIADSLLAFLGNLHSVVLERPRVRLFTPMELFCDLPAPPSQPQKIQKTNTPGIVKLSESTCRTWGLLIIIMEVRIETTGLRQSVGARRKNLLH
jgi:hypothetical protein